jgi:putative peptidoglycan lipid II flippase
MVFKRWFSSQTNSITVAATLVAVSSLLSRFLGIFRDRILAGQFGASQALDWYYSAFRIPDLIFNLLVLGALSAGFIPVFASLIKNMKCDKLGCYSLEGNSEAWKLANNLLNALILVMAGLSLIGFIFAPQLIGLMTPGFDSEARLVTVKLTRIMFLSPIFLGVSGILGGILQSFKNFVVYSLTPVLYNLGIIIGALVFVPRLGIYGLAWGVVLGAAMHMLVQIPAVCHLGFRYERFLSFKDANLRRIGMLMIPRTMSLAITQINLLIITVIASNLESGSLTVFNFANNLQSFPVGIFGISFAIAAFPVLAANANRTEELVKNFSLTLRQILFFMIPATVLILTLRAQLVRVIFGSGVFSWRDTEMTFNALSFFALSLFAQALIPLLTRVFYARQDSKTPFYIGLITVAANILLSIWLSPKLGVAGLALAFSLSNILNFILLWLWLYSSIGDLDQANILRSTLKFSAAALAAGGAIQVMKALVWPFVDMERFSGIFWQGLLAGLVGLITYFFSCYLLRSQEFLDFWRSFRRRLPLIKFKSDDQGEVRGL